MPVFRVRQYITTYADAFIEAESETSIATLLQSMSEQNEHRLQEAIELQDGEEIDYEVEMTRAEPLLKVKGDRFIPV